MSDSLDVLELRIHGVNNTPPWNVLELPEAAIVQYEGDALGNFWHPVPAAQASLPPSDPGLVPSGVLREAYSWGGMARNSIGGSSRIGKIVSGAARLGWTLLLPFSLLNMAYWSRRLAQPDRSPHPGWHNAGGAAVIRLAALAMTLLMAATVSVLSLDVVAVQCYTGPTCAKFPSAVQSFGHWHEGQRLALMSLVPVLAATFLYVLTSISAVRYTQTSTAARAWTSDGGDAVDAAFATPRWPLLSTKGFWTPVRILVQTSRLHLAAVAALVSLITAWQTVFGTGSSCETLGSIRHSPACRAQVDATGGRWIAGVVVIGVSFVLLLLIAFQVMRVSEDSADIERSKQRPSRPITLILVIVAATTFSFQFGVLAAWRDASRVPESAMAGKILGMSEIPEVLVALVIGLALASLTSRYVVRKPRRIMQALGVAVAALLLFSATNLWHHRLSLVLDGIALLIVVGFGVIVVRGPLKDGRRYEAWRGCAPGVFIALALVSSMVLSSAVIVATANLLNGSNSAASIAGTRLSACPRVSTNACLQVPRLYAWFAAMLIPMIALILALFALVLFRTRKAASQIPDGPPVAPGAKGALFSGASKYPPIQPQVGHARWFASLTHRAECYAGALAALGGAALFAAIAVTVSDWSPKPNARPAELVDWALGTGIWGLATLGGTVIALVAGGPAAGNTRPLGLVWDLVCFLPKAAHPFGPPCYSERVVPELLGRYESWLTGDVQPTVTDRESPTPQQGNRRIVLSAHSLGSVLAVATIFATFAPAEERDPVSAAKEAASRQAIAPISLLTYGSQLRAYFGRILPELVGPEVLGVKPCRAARLFTVDPWSRERTNEAPIEIDSHSLRALLKPRSDSRWINLWRRTDYIGFPVVEYADDGSPTDDIDRYAEEVDETGYLLKVLTYSDYPRVPAYFKAFDDLRSRGLLPRRRWFGSSR
jgi:hypothetical protein